MTSCRSIVTRHYSDNVTSLKLQLASIQNIVHQTLLAAKAIKPAAHVREARSDPDACARRQPDHARRLWKIVLNSAASAPWRTGATTIGEKDRHWPPHCPRSGNFAGQGGGSTDWAMCQDLFAPRRVRQPRNKGSRTKLVEVSGSGQPGSELKSGGLTGFWHRGCGTKSKGCYLGGAA